MAHISELVVFPIKSCRGISTQAATLTNAGALRHLNAVRVRDRSGPAGFCLRWSRSTLMGPPCWPGSHHAAGKDAIEHSMCMGTSAPAASADAHSTDADQCCPPARTVPGFAAPARPSQDSAAVSACPQCAAPMTPAAWRLAVNTGLNLAAGYLPLLSQVCAGTVSGWWSRQLLMRRAGTSS
jgi:hypothetical protein